MVKKVALIAVLFVLTAGNAWAIQEHGGVEAHYVHQLAHVFFVVSMVVLMVVLKGPVATRGSGWPLIRLAAFCFILWNVDAFFGHYFATGVEPRADYIVGDQIILKDMNARLYYYTSLIENVFLGSAFVFLALGLRSLWGRMKEDA